MAVVRGTRKRKRLFPDNSPCIHLLLDQNHSMATPHRVLIIGGGFAGLNCARFLGNDERFEVTLLDRENHHLFQPLLYQVATAALSAPDIAR